MVIFFLSEVAPDAGTALWQGGLVLASQEEREGAIEKS